MIFKNVKKELIEQEMKITDIADAIGYSREHVSGVINGHHDSPKVKKMIALVLRKDFDFLWTLGTQAQTETTV